MNFVKIANEKLEEWVLVTVLVFMTLLVLLQIFSRFVIDISVGWTEELSRFLLIWVSWISASYAIQKDAHIRIEFMKNIFGGKSEKVIDLISHIAFFVVALFLCVEGTKLVMNIKLTNQISPSMEMPMWIVYIIIPLGGLLMTIRLTQKIIGVIRQ